MPRFPPTTIPPSSRSRPRSPFNGWPVQWSHPEVGYAWYVEPAALIVQSFLGHGTVSATTEYMDLVDRILETKSDAVAEAGGLLVLSDWRHLKTYEPESRNVVLERIKQRPRGYLRRTLLCVDAPPMLRLAVQVANLGAAMLGNGSIEICGDVHAAVAQHRLVSPGPGARFPGA